MVSDRQKPGTEKVDLEAHEWLAERASMATNMAYMGAKKLSCAVVVSKGVSTDELKMSVSLGGGVISNPLHGADNIPLANK